LVMLGDSITAQQFYSFICTAGRDIDLSPGESVPEALDDALEEIQKHPGFESQPRASRFYLIEEEAVFVNYYKMRLKTGAQVKFQRVDALYRGFSADALADPLPADGNEWFDRVLHSVLDTKHRSPKDVLLFSTGRHFHGAEGHRRLRSHALKLATWLKANWPGIIIFRTLYGSQPGCHEAPQVPVVVGSSYRKGDDDLNAMIIEAFQKVFSSEKGRTGGRFHVLNISMFSDRMDGKSQYIDYMPIDAPGQWSDCSHWCLPGPIDDLQYGWNAMMLNLIKQIDQYDSRVS